MSGKYLLDTSVAIAILRNESAVVQAATQAEELFLCEVVLGELYFGAYRSANPQLNRERIEQLAQRCTTLWGGKQVAERYGMLKAQLLSQGTPIPENDLWIAATALSYDITLVSRDAHFQRVPGLRLVVW